MPELPDVVVYIEALERCLAGARLDGVRLFHPFVLRSVEPPLSAVVGKEVRGLRRLGKRIVIELGDGLFIVLHLMIAGRLRWKVTGAKPPGKIGLAALDFSTGTLILTGGSRASAARNAARSASSTSSPLAHPVLVRCTAAQRWR